MPMTWPIKWLHCGSLLFHDTMNSWHLHKFANWIFCLSYKQVSFEWKKTYEHSLLQFKNYKYIIGVHRLQYPIMNNYVSWLLERKLTTIANMSCTPFNIIDQTCMWLTSNYPIQVASKHGQVNQLLYFYGFEWQVPQNLSQNCETCNLINLKTRN
jgi:hypothetical protein